MLLENGVALRGGDRHLGGALDTVGVHVVGLNVVRKAALDVGITQGAVVFEPRDLVAPDGEAGVRRRPSPLLLLLCPLLEVVRRQEYEDVFWERCTGEHNMFEFLHVFGLF